jgi:hypothetical protein
LYFYGFLVCFTSGIPRAKSDESVSVNAQSIAIAIEAAMFAHFGSTNDRYKVSNFLSNYPPFDFL